jgi:hypothetical protein
VIQLPNRARLLGAGLALTAILATGCQPPAAEPTSPPEASASVEPSLSAEASLTLTPSTFEPPQSGGGPVSVPSHRAAPPVHKPTVRRTTARPRPRPHPTTQRPGVAHGVHQGAWCKPAGAYGYTSNGTRMQCKGPGQPRWRAA